MRAKDIKIGKTYRLKSSPSYGYIKAVEVLPPKTRENIKNCILVKFIHSCNDDFRFGAMRYFKPVDVIEVVL